MASLQHGSSAIRGCCQVTQTLRRLHRLRTSGVAAPLGAARHMTSIAEYNPLTDVMTGTSGIHARAVPVSPSYFSRQPRFNDSYLLLVQLAERYRKLPLIPKDQVQPVAWKNLENFRQAVGEHVKATEFVKCMTLVKALNQIHPEMRPKEVDDALLIFKKAVQPYLNIEKTVPIDKFGRALGSGRRKTSVARAWVVEGTGEMLVNGKTLADAFGRVHDRESATWALRATGRTDKYNVWALVEGGGTTGQAEALTLAIGKALMAHEPALKPALRRGMHSTHVPVLCHAIPTEANMYDTSWLCHSRSPEGRKEEAGPCQGEKDARLGEEIVSQHVSMGSSLEASSDETAFLKVLPAGGRILWTGLLAWRPFQGMIASAYRWHGCAYPPT
jgi:small subunit ribosomal protein S9